MKQFLYKLTNWILAGFGVAAAVGLSYTLFPEYFAFAFEAIGMSESQIANATVVLSGITVFGGMSKYLSGVVKTQQTLVESNTERKISMLEDRHQAQLDKIREEKNEETKIYSGIINELIDKQNDNGKMLDQVVQILAITAKRNANTNTNLVSDEDKELYRQFLQGLADKGEGVDVANLYTELTVIEEVETKKKDKDKLEERL